MDKPSLADEEVMYLSVGTSQRPFLPPLPSTHYLVGVNLISTEMRVLDAGGKAAIMAIDPARDHIVLIRAFRLAGHLVEGAGSMIDLPVAATGSNHSIRFEPEQASRCCAELLKVSPLRMAWAFKMMPAPAVSTELVDFFIAEVDGAELPKLVECDLASDNYEILSIPIDDALGALQSNALVSGVAIAGLQWLALNRASLPERLAHGERES